MKKEIILQIVIFISLYILWYILYPETLISMEENAFFISTNDYWTQMMAKPGGLGVILGNYLCQFYRWREIGALLQTLYPLIICAIYVNLLYRAQNKAIRSIIFLPLMYLIWMQLNGFTPVYAVQYVIFMGAIALYANIWNKNLRRFVFILMPPVLLLLLPAGIVLWFYITAALIEYLIYGKQIRSLIAPLSGFMISGVILFLWHQYKYIPINERWVYPALNHRIFIIYGFPIGILLISKLISIKNQWVNITAAILTIIVTIVSFTTSKSAKQKETIAAIEHDAIAKDWNRLLNRLHPKEIQTNKLYLRYALLALSEKGQLTNHLFTLDPSPDCFTFYRSTEIQHEYFNSFYYASLGIYNESIRQAFEAGLMNETGTNFRTIRLITDWYLRMGNRALAEKYLTILNHSTCHKKWIERRQPLLQELKQMPPVTPDKSEYDIFIGAYPPVVEISELLKDDPENLRKQEYYLCTLLLIKDLEKFEIALSNLTYLQQTEKFPVCFQEALCIMHHKQQNLRITEKYQLSSALQKKHENFMQLQHVYAESPESEQYKNSYWNYYYSK